jgi:hypothetical protein
MEEHKLENTILRAENSKEISRIKEEHSKEILRLQNEMKKLREEFSEEISHLKGNQLEELSKSKENYERELSYLQVGEKKNSHYKIFFFLQKQIDERNSTLLVLQKQVDDLSHVSLQEPGAGSETFGEFSSVEPKQNNVIVIWGKKHLKVFIDFIGNERLASF